MKKLLIPFLALFAALQSDGATSIQQHGITWTFEKEYEVGQFINGDYYVIDPGDGVNLISISPKPSAGNNGSMINPVTGKNQGYDSGIAYYNAASSVKLPATLRSGQSLVSTMSHTDSDFSNGGYTPSWTSERISKSHVALKTAAVLTVLNEVPPSDSFRPPFVGGDKPIFRYSQVDLGELPKLVPPESAPRNDDYFARGLQRPWLTHLSGWTCREMHPSENMKNYHEYIGQFWSDVSAYMLTAKRTDELTINYIQTGIDLYYMSVLGQGDSSFFKWPVVFTGLLLDEPEIYNVFKDGRNRTPGRTEKLFYFWKDHKSTIKSAIVPEGQTYSGETVFFRKQVGNTEHEHLHPSEWYLVDNGGGLKQESYRHCCDSQPHMGMILCARILKKEDLWADDAAIAYADRWMTEDFKPFQGLINDTIGALSISSNNAGSHFLNDMWAIYRYMGAPVDPSDLKTDS